MVRYTPSRGAWYLLVGVGAKSGWRYGEASLNRKGNVTHAYRAHHKSRLKPVLVNERQGGIERGRRDGLRIACDHHSEQHVLGNPLVVVARGKASPKRRSKSKKAEQILVPTRRSVVKDDKRLTTPPIPNVGTGRD